jgi:hypothetical protein
MAMTTRFRFRAGLALLLVFAGALNAQAPASRLVHDTVHSAALEGNKYGDSPNRSVLVYLPPSYASNPTKRYPVVYLLTATRRTKDRGRVAMLDSTSAAPPTRSWQPAPCAK